MKIAYVHGFASSGKSRTADILRKYLPDDEIIAYDIPVCPREAIEFLREMIHEEDIDLVVGTSLGAYYALHTSGCAKIAINPPYDPNARLDNFLGQDVEFLNPREDGEKSFKWESVYHKQLEYYDQELIESDFEILCESQLFFGVDDDVVNDSEKFENYWTKTKIPGGHRVSEEVFVEHILPSILKIREYFKEN